MNQQSIEQAAELLARALTGERMPDLPAELIPTSAEDAYAIQDAGLKREQGVGGWKVAPAKEGETPRCAPIGTSRFIADGATLPTGLHAPEVEVELAFKLRHDLPPRAAPYEENDFLDAVGSAHVALEVLDSRFIDRKQVSVLTALADGQSNRFVAVGEGIEEFRDVDSLKARPVLEMAGKLLEVGKELPTTAALIGACVWLANHASARGLGLRAGEVIITGSRVGPVPITANLSARIDQIGRVSLKLA